jgi:GntR family transcriptional regulator, transcriptional repressor for pyruvate dehydrogenase complex
MLVETSDFWDITVMNSGVQMKAKSATRSRRSAKAGGMFTPQPITGNKTLADQVTESLTSKILAKNFTDSQLPSEQALAEGFGVSRTVIREAVSRLKAEGLIDTRQGRGAFVRNDRLDVPFRIDLNSKDLLGSLLHIIELRRGLDAEIAFLAATRRKRDQMFAIRRALGDIEKASKAGRDAAAEDLAFHLSIARATGNPLFLELLSFLNRFLYIGIRVTRAHEDKRVEFSEQTRVEHMAIADAIERQDAEAAATAAKIHMINAAVRIKSADADFWTVELRHLAQSLDKEVSKKAQHDGVTRLRSQKSRTKR